KNKSKFMVYFRKRKYKITNRIHGQIYVYNCSKNIRDLALEEWALPLMENFYRYLKNHRIYRSVFGII
ncbi:hypothetical protein, partial [Parashewanella curva]|uniref:hypothetical protein n=1 Tax=Parashewanella curva TaxID=2338552 RepID=UPI001A9EA900